MTIPAWLYIAIGFTAIACGGLYIQNGGAVAVKGFGAIALGGFSNLYGANLT